MKKKPCAEILWELFGNALPKALCWFLKLRSYISLITKKVENYKISLNNTNNFSSFYEENSENVKDKINKIKKLEDFW